jgi:DNA invertase Pin-like site-specific DNA recombinase
MALQQRILCPYDFGLTTSQTQILCGFLFPAGPKTGKHGLVWRFDRFARSTKHLILALEEFRNLGIDFVSYQENIDTSSPLGSAIFTIISAVAQLERDIIAERVKAGLRRAVEAGKRLGRPRGDGSRC